MSARLKLMVAAMVIVCSTADKGDRAAAQSLKKLQAQTTSSSREGALPSTPKSRAEKDDCEKGYEEAMSYAVGMNRVHIKTKEAVKRLEALAKAECAEAVAELVAVGYEGSWAPWVPKDEASAQELANIALADGLEQRADEGRPNAQFGLSVFYRCGLGVAKDSDKAWQLAVQAAKGGCAIAQFYLGLCYYDPSDDSGKNLERAAYWYEQAAAQGHANAQFRLGLMYLKGIGVPGDMNKAAQLIQQAANQGHDQASTELKNRLCPQNATAYYNRGAAYAKLGQYQNAIDDYTEAVNLAPKYAKAYAMRGCSLAVLGQRQKAIDDCSKAISLDPKNTKLIFGRGIAYGILGEWQKAIDDYNEVISLDPKDAEAYYYRGRNYRDLKQHERASQDYNRAIPTDKNGYVISFNEKAIQDYNRAIELKPGYATAYFSRGNAYSDLKQFNKAIRDYDRAIELKPDYAEAKVRRDIAYKHLKQ